MPDEPASDEPQPFPEQPTLFGNVDPGEMMARGMQSVKMTGGAQGTWQPPSVGEAAGLFIGYEVVKLLGRGGMGVVYQAREIELDRLVAIKLLPLEVSVEKEFADRFRREARAMAKLNHPNIIAVHAFGTTKEGHLYFAMEYVEGANLAEVIHKVGLDSDQALSIAEQVCKALSYAHDKGVVHRDIKPANVMIDSESHVKVADFGLARLIDSSATGLGQTMTGTVMGTPDYMAPEQMKGMNVDHRADIYSVGVMIYEMICGEVPRGAFAPPSVRAGCDPRIDPLVLKAMQPNPDHRYQTTREMKGEVSSTRLSLPDGVGTPLLVSNPAPASGALAAGNPITPAAPAKSKTLLYAGLAVGMTIAAFAAFLFFKPKSEPVVKSEPSAAGPRQIDGTAGVSPSAGLWQDALADRSNLYLDHAEVTSDGLRFDGKGSLQFAHDWQRDGAVRIRARAGDGVPKLMIRKDRERGCYNLIVGKAELRLERWDEAAQKAGLVKKLALPHEIKDGEEYLVELRAVGDTVSAKFNSQEMGSMTDGTYPEGRIMIMSTQPGDGNGRSFIKSVEVLNLNATPPEHP